MKRRYFFGIFAGAIGAAVAGFRSKRTIKIKSKLASPIPLGESLKELELPDALPTLLPDRYIMVGGNPRKVVPFIEIDTKNGKRLCANPEWESAPYEMKATVSELSPGLGNPWVCGMTQVTYSIEKRA